MTDGEAAEAFEAAGWSIRGKQPSGEEGVVGEAGRYAIRTTEKLLGSETVFELHDEELNMKVYAQGPLPGTGGGVDRGVRCPGGDLGHYPWQDPYGAPWGGGGSVAPEGDPGNSLRRGGETSRTPTRRRV
jgi:hypothetical protein